ncbi:hypothetical protein PMI10_03724 [Flavobacterium sp. CF136]|nr:hypothetical protein PMI10_03724 [Flavobacterium sp. CF136]
MINKKDTRSNLQGKTPMTHSMIKNKYNYKN